MRGFGLVWRERFVLRGWVPNVRYVARSARTTKRHLSSPRKRGSSRGDTTKAPSRARESSKAAQRGKPCSVVEAWMLAFASMTLLMSHFLLAFPRRSNFDRSEIAIDARSSRSNGLEH